MSENVLVMDKDWNGQDFFEFHYPKFNFLFCLFFAY